MEKWINELDEKSYQAIMIWQSERAKRRKERRRRIFAFIGWMKKELRKTAPRHTPLLVQCGAPASRGRGVVTDSSPLPRGSGAAIDLCRKAMPERDDEKKGRNDTPPSSCGDDTPDGYQGGYK